MPRTCSTTPVSRSPLELSREQRIRVTPTHGLRLRLGATDRRSKSQHSRLAEPALAEGRCSWKAALLSNLALQYSSQTETADHRRLCLLLYELNPMNPGVKSFASLLIFVLGGSLCF